MKNLLKDLHGLAGTRSENQAIGPVEIFDSTSVGKEHGLRDDRRLQSDVPDGFFQGVGSPDRNGSDDGQDRGLWREACNANRDVVQVLGLVFGEKDDSSPAGEGFDISGIGEAASTHVTADNFFEILLEEWDVALGH